MSIQSSRESQAIFTGAVPVLPTTDLSQATSFYGQLGFQVLHQEAEYAIVTRDGVELHLWLSNPGERKSWLSSIQTVS